MSKRTIVLFSIFIIVAVVGSIFIYHYRSYADLLIKQYISKITTCENILDEQDCYAKDFCEGIYGPSCPDCHDSELKWCQRIPMDVLVLLEKERHLCVSSGGEWERNKLGNFCLCQKAGINKTFNKTKGCVNK